MITFLTFFILFALLGLIWKLIKLAIKATWSITKIIFSIVLLPLSIVYCVLKGFIFIALGLFVVNCIVGLFKS